jgi:arylformamidase
MKRIYDISVPIYPGMPVWPGDPKVTIRQVSSIGKGDEANVSQMRMSVHTGTHIDAPKHFIEDGKTLDQIPLEKLTGGVLVMDMGEDVKEITADSIKSNPQFNELLNTSKIIFKTSNSRLWETYPETFYEDYVGVTASAAQFLAGKSLDLIGVDYLSIAPFTETDLPHQILLEKEIILLEAVNLSGVPAGTYTLFCLPLNIVGCEGAPARVILVLE